MRVIFFGTPQFAASCLDYLLKNGVEVVAVVTKPDKAQGRSSALVPTPVKTVALSQNPPLPLFQPPLVSALEFADTLAAFNADLFVVVAYGEILKQHLLDMPKIACINLHASLLPKYRGAAPIQRCLINGETETGVSVMHMVKKMDAGDVIAMEKMDIPSSMTYGELELALCQLGSPLLLKSIQDFIDGESVRIPQNHELATFAPKIELEDCRIDWNRSSTEIHDLVRGVNPHPGAWCFIPLKEQLKRLRIISTIVMDVESQNQPGSIISSSKEGVVVACGHGSLLVSMLQPEGKTIMKAADFFRGCPQASTIILN